VTDLGGLAIPAHIDRPSFSLLANLGFVPPHLEAPALEIFRLSEPATLLARHPSAGRYPLVRDSDAHQLSEMRRGIAFEADTASFENLRAALAIPAGITLQS